MTTNDPSRIREAIRNFINNSINIDTLGDDENLFESGIVNSLFAVQLMTFLERNFGIHMEPDDLEIENFKSVSATTAFLLRKTAAQAGLAVSPSGVTA